MKKTIITLMVASAALVACQKEKEINPVSLGETVNITIIASQDNASKTVLIGTDVKWTAGDKVTVMYKKVGESTWSTAESSAASTSDAYLTATFEATLTTPDAEKNAYAIYPANALEQDDADNAIITIAATQHPTGTSIDGGSDIMISKPFTPSTSPISTQFARANAVLKIKINNASIAEEKLVSLSVTGANALAGDVLVGLSDKTVKGIENGSNTVIAEYATENQFKLGASGKYIYLIVKPQTLANGSTITIQGVTESHRFTKSIVLNQDIHLNAGHIIPLTISDTDMVVTEAGSLAGDFIIVGKPTSSGFWQVMTSTIDGSGRWAQTTTSLTYDTDVNVAYSSVDFPEYSNDAYRFTVESYGGGYALKNYSSGKYITYYGSGNAGKEQDAAVKFDDFSIAADGVATMKVNVSSDYYSLRYSSANNWFSFYKNGGQQDIYLIPYVHVDPAHNLALSTETITLPGTAGRTETINVTSNYAWTAILDGGASGFTVTPSGAGNGTITITANANGTAIEETLGTFTVSDGKDNIIVTVKQSAYVPLLTDVLTSSWAGTTTGSSYVTWDNKAGSSSEAVYAGNSNRGVNYIQLRSDSPSGIITTSSGGFVRRVEVDYSTSKANTDAKYLTVYGSNAAFSSGDNPSGTYLGRITFNTGDVSEGLDITGDYAYLGIKANAAMYFDEIRITWDPTPATPTFSLNEGTYYGAQSVTLSAADGATIYYTVDGSVPTNASTIYSSAISIPSTTTINAIAIKGGATSAVASATFTIVDPTQLVMTTVSCTAQTHRSLTFGWDAVANATGYKVSLDDGANWIDNGTNTAYTWTALSASTTYTLKVKALGTANGQYTDSDPESCSATTTVTPLLVSITLTTNPTKTSYILGESFSFDGAVVTATYSDSSTDNVTAFCTTNGNTVVASAGTNKDVTITYIEGGITKTTTFQITVTEQHYYVKVTTTPGDWSGEYLIVYEKTSTSAVVFDGSLANLDGGRNVVDGNENTTFTISEGKIAATDALNAATFTVSATTVKSKSGKWINQTSWNNGLSSYSSSSTLHGVSINGDGNLVVQGTGSSNGSYVQLCFNKVTGESNYRFRFYKTPGGNNAAIALYKYQ